MKIGQHETHPAADVFPMMTQDRLSELCVDIKAHGLINPIVLHGGMILDGRNRARACAETGTAPIFTEWTGDDPYAFVWSQNGQRRDMTDAQRYLCRKECVEASDAMRAEQERIVMEANEKRALAMQGNQNAASKNSSASTGGTTVSAKVHATSEAKAKLAGVGSKTVEKMDTLVSRRPDLAEQVKNGTCSAIKAITIAREEAQQNGTTRKIPSRKHVHDDVAESEIDAQIREMFGRNMPTKRIAEHIGKSPSFVSYATARLGLRSSAGNRMPALLREAREQSGFWESYLSDPERHDANASAESKVELASELATLVGAIKKVINRLNKEA